LTFEWLHFYPSLSLYPPTPFFHSPTHTYVRHYLTLLQL
jgi:hypothetical protein